MPTSTAAAPTKLCSMATSSGIEVIATRDARNAPMTQPTPSAPASRPTADSSWPLCAAGLPGSSSATAVIRTASAIPKVPNALPRRAVSWVDSPRRLRMNSMLAARYDKPRSVPAIASTYVSNLFAEHLQHALRDQEPARDVDRSQQDRDAAQDRGDARQRARPATRAGGDHQHAADQDDAADRVGDAHERRVQGRRDVPDHVPADDAREQKHRQVLQQLGRTEQAGRAQQQDRRAERDAPGHSVALALALARPVAVGARTP